MLYAVLIINACSVFVVFGTGMAVSCSSFISSLSPHDGAELLTDEASTLLLGLQQLYDRLGGAAYDEITSMLSRQIPADSEALCAHVEAGEWGPAQQLTHKIMGAALSLGLDYATDASELNATLKRVLAGSDAASEDEARIQCASIAIVFNAIAKAAEVTVVRT